MAAEVGSGEILIGNGPVSAHVHQGGFHAVTSRSAIAPPGVLPAMAGPMAFGPAYRFRRAPGGDFRGTAARGSPSGGHRPRDLMHSHADGCRLGAVRARVGRLWRSLFADGLDALAGRVHEVVGDLVGLSGRPVDLPGVVPQGLHP